MKAASSLAWTWDWHVPFLDNRKMLREKIQIKIRSIKDTENSDSVVNALVNPKGEYPPAWEPEI